MSLRPHRNQLPANLTFPGFLLDRKEEQPRLLALANTSSISAAAETEMSKELPEIAKTKTQLENKRLAFLLRIGCSLAGECGMDVHSLAFSEEMKRIESLMPISDEKQNAILAILAEKGFSETVRKVLDQPQKRSARKTPSWHREEERVIQPLADPVSMRDAASRLSEDQRAEALGVTNAIADFMFSRGALENELQIEPKPFE